MGIVTSLYGLAIFNLHYWGFGVPFVMVGAWYLVRTYRLHRKLKEATAGGAVSDVPFDSEQTLHAPYAIAIVTAVVGGATRLGRSAG